jgi:hypothetical protein
MKYDIIINNAKMRSCAPHDEQKLWFISSRKLSSLLGALPVIFQDNFVMIYIFHVL